MSVTPIYTTLISFSILLGCSSGPHIDQTSDSKISYLPLLDSTTPVQSIGWNAELEIKSGCVAAYGAPLILRPDFHVRESSSGVHLFERDRYIASVGDTIGIGGHLVDSLDDLVDSNQLSCEANLYFLVDDVSKR